MDPIQGNNPPEGSAESSIPPEDVARYGLLYLTARKDDWKTVKKFIDDHAEIDEFGVTNLHLLVRNAESSNPPESDTESYNFPEDIAENQIERQEENNRGHDFTMYRPLCRATQKGDRTFVENFLNGHPEFLTRGLLKINEDGATILHLAVYKEETMWLVDNILNAITLSSSLDSLEAAENTGNTALSYAAIVGNKEAASKLVEKKESLLLKRDMNDYTPLHHAAKVGHKKTVEFLLSKTKDNVVYKDLFIGESGATLLKLLISSNMYGIALDILKQYMKFDENHFIKKEVLRTLAEKPQEFESGNHNYLNCWQRLIYQWIPILNDNSTLPQILIETPTNCLAKFTNFGVFQRISNGFGKVCPSFWNRMKQVRWINDIHDEKLRRMQALELVKLICKGMINLTFEQAEQILKEPLFIATRLGVMEFVNEILEVFPDSISFYNEKNQNIFQFAVLHRQEHVFKIIYKMDIWTHFIASDTDSSGNNILHLAGKLELSSQISGPALQMRQELQWFKAIEDIIVQQRPSLQEDRNDDNLTPREVFTKAHKNLVEEGQKWMKDTAKSYIIVAALIITVTFAAAFALPGGYGSDGVPPYSSMLAFWLFVASDAISLLFACISVLKCLEILHSSYPEEDFLVSLPKMLALSLITLYVSLGFMIAAFSSALNMVFAHTKTQVPIPIIILVYSIPFLFALFQFSLPFKILGSTYFSNRTSENSVS